VKPQQASSTAKLIAAGTLLLANDARTSGLVTPEAAALCEHVLAGGPWATRADRWLAASTRHAGSRACWCALERQVLPGIVRHFAHRKRWIERQCCAAIASGCARVIVLGAGFDTLGCRLCLETDQIEVIEVDHPATQAAKRAAIDALPSRLKAPLRLIACDLAHDDLPAALLNDPRQAVVIAEGLLMYLDDRAVDRLFGQVHMLSPAGVQFVFSHLVQWPSGPAGLRPRSRLIDAWLAWRGEPFTSAIAPHALPALLQRHGFSMIDSATPTDLAAGVTLLGENLVHCRAR
jgi:methyltransferase (TIGR00027 family)